MSVEATSWVWCYSAAKGNDRLVLLAIADHAWSDGTNAYPSQARLAEFTQLSVSTVRRCIRSLVAAGELVTELGTGPKTRGGDGRIRQTNGYRMTLSTGSTTGVQIDPPPFRRVVKTAMTGVHTERDGWSAVTDKPTTNQERTTRTESECLEHRGQLFHSCSGCRSEQLAVDRTATR